MIKKNIFWIMITAVFFSVGFLLGGHLSSASESDSINRKFILTMLSSRIESSLHALDFIDSGDIDAAKLIIETDGSSAALIAKKVYKVDRIKISSADTDLVSLKMQVDEYQSRKDQKP